MNRLMITVLATTALTAVGPAAASELVADQAAGSDMASGLEDIVVTAQKRAENLQSTPHGHHLYKPDYFCR